jgi:hypothetical protein
MRAWAASLVLLSAALASASPSFAQAYTPPRTPDGRPDFQGTWTSGWITPLERPPEANSLVLQSEDARRVYAAVFERMDAFDPFGPNDNWDLDSLAVVRGQTRSSLIVDPPDGRIPFSDEGKKRRAALPPPAGVDGPEQRPRNERCLVDANSIAPFLTLPAGNIRQIVQTPGSFLIHTESFSQLRIVPTSGQRAVNGTRGWWEGDTLVIETAGFAPTDRFRFTRLLAFVLAPGTRITERLTRIAEDEILYSFTVEDALLYTRPWTAEMSLRKTDAHIYEWGCQEANYGLANILRGARVVEERAAKAAKAKQ